MKRLALALSMFLAVAVAQASVSDAPHNASNSIVCSDCHTYSLWWEFSPTNNVQDAILHKSVVDTICSHCHYDGADIPYELGHASATMGGLHNEELGDWQRACTDCHDPHFQPQLNWSQSFAENLYLVQGEIEAYSIQTSGTGTSADPFISKFSFSNAQAGLNSEWADLIDWRDKPEEWSRKSGVDGRGLIVAIPAEAPTSTFEIVSVDTQWDDIIVRGKIDAAFNPTGITFGLIYGQLIKDSIEGRPVKLFNPSLAYSSGATGGYADPVAREGLCQVCHSDAAYWTFDDQCRDLNGTVEPCLRDDFDPQGNPIQVSYQTNSHNSSGACTNCHLHNRGFAPGSDRGKHTDHSTLGYTCTACHGSNIPPMMADGVDLAATTVCAGCHNDGRWTYDTEGNPLAPGLPNKQDYKENWANENYFFGCNGCHLGRADNPADIGSIECDSDAACRNCHRGPRATSCTDPDCGSCHDGTGTITHLLPSEDIQANPVGMRSNGHGRLASTQWIRMYPCSYCHRDTVAEDGTLIQGGKHLNSYNLVTREQNDSSIDVVIADQWSVSNQAAPYYTDEHHPPGPTEDPDSCYNTYCHSDGTSVAPVMKSYPWAGGSEECNGCHSHDLNNGNCDTCHEMRSWAPEDRWLSAMPMYENLDENGNPLTGTDGANSHFRHLFTGFSCDDCHVDTVVGACRDCHGDEELHGTMTEDQHVNPDKHVKDKRKTVVFKNGGTYDERNGFKTCSNTACHTGYAPVWGGSVLDAVTCKSCHGINGPDVDDFGSFNGVRGKINLTEWASVGHGRPLAAGDYPSGNPPANFPQNGCWYCHDNTVLHQNPERPYRLIQHEQFNQRFEKECVFCHMVARADDNSECDGCHNDEESLAPQMDTTPSQHALDGSTDVCADCHKESRSSPSTVDHLSCTTAECHLLPPAFVVDHRTYNQTNQVGGEAYCSACHVDDESRHKTGAGTWSADQKRDVKNSYLQMGVCLKCHDDDNKSADGTYSQCYVCHAQPVDDPLTTDVDESLRYELGFDPGLPGTYRITPQKAKASSFHFGHKHYEAYTASIDVQVEQGVVSDTDNEVNTLVDTDKSWSVNQWYGYYVKMFDGPNIGQVRKIISNTSDTLTVTPGFSEPVQASNIYEIQIETGAFTDTAIPAELVDSTKAWVKDQWTGYSVQVTSGGSQGEVRRISNSSADTLFLATPFSQGVEVGDSYKIIMPVWKGGKFCWDCHDPHGDGNIYMIQNMVATRTEGTVGKPISRATVRFLDKDHLGLSYVRMNEPYDGICNVCHSEGSQHYAADRGDGHNAGRLCTECHEHRFTDSHSDHRPCNECHMNKPVPRHSGFGQPRDCTKCHQGAIGNRMNIMGQFAAKSHHVQGVEVTNKHCYACHWESDEHGLINRTYHQGYNNKTFGSSSNREVDLVVWNDTKRPTEYILGETATQFTARNMLDGGEAERAEIEQITPHCLGCHSDLNNETTPFDDCKTPRQYAWDESSIADRYSDNSTTVWGKYPTVANAAQKNIVKALSAHGNAGANGGGFSTTDGVDGTIPNTRNGNHAVQCFDCHNSHGSKVSGITSSYYSFRGDRNGANLKETQAGKGGYQMTYYASAYTNPQSVNYYEAGAGQCFDCHETADSGLTPWGYSSTFGAEQPIMGYTDTSRFGQGPRAVHDRYAYKSTTIMGGHLKASSSIQTAPRKQINGLCTPCHDPHGVSKSLGANRSYGVPLLKGTWMTSPYKEDVTHTDGVSGPRGARYMEPPPTPIPFVYTDQKTFGTERILETDEKFAGLCLSCHSKEALTDGINNNGPWKSIDRLHESVRGWGDNEMHSYTCSKCHLPHNSTLPRLMQTNCLNADHRGRVAAGGLPGSNADLLKETSCELKSFAASFPYGRSPSQRDWGNYMVNCHPTGTWPDNSWNGVTPW